ncbi:MAG: hypothetical protein HJJLKODD_01129 [Phycisphaerae bacterium]|nr:hypothetical protein [Phycisphaerae bacterium]
MSKPSRWWVVVLVLVCAPQVRAENYLNLDFETGRAQQPRNWYVGGQGYEGALDSGVAQSGKQSLRLKYLSGASFGVGTQTFPLEAVKGKKITYRGYIRSEGITRGYAGLWWRVDGTKGQVLGFDNMDGRGVTGTTEWTKAEISMTVDPAVTNINFGVILTGDGTAWFDALQVEIDSVAFAQQEPQIPQQPTAEQTAWLKQHAVALKSVQAGQDFDDLQPLKKMIGNARIVALGEVTHGTKEIFQMKHRLVEYLVKEMGYTIFAIEANMPESYKMNDYVLSGAGDPREILNGMYFWTWNTREVLSMVEWMREFNAAGKGPIEFVGFDMQTPNVAMQIVLDFMREHDSESLASAETSYQMVRQAREASTGQWGPSPEQLPLWRSAEEAAAAVFKHLENNRVKLQGDRPVKEFDWIIQNARVVLQCCQMNTSEVGRDQSMAENVRWILQQNPQAKLVIWAHNGHVNRLASTMGYELAKWYGEDYRVVGFTANRGEYTALLQGVGLQANPLQPGDTGTIELFLQSTGLPLLLLDLRQAEAGSATSGWLRQEMDMRSIGALAQEMQFFPVVVTDLYDLLIYLDQTTPTELLFKN